MKNKTKQLSIEEKNKAFNKFGKLKQRVEIAKDVLEQLDAKYLIAKPGNYVDYRLTLNSHDDEQEIKEALDKRKSCTACGIGSLFVCTVKKFNKIKFGDLSYGTGSSISQDDIHSYMGKYFTSFELYKIEAAFERTGSLHEFMWNTPKYRALEKAANYFNNFNGEKLKPNERLKAIMNNIIKNNGVFRVTKKYGEI